MEDLIKELETKLTLGESKFYETLLLKNESEPYCVYKIVTFVEATPELKKKLLNICGLVEGIAMFDYTKSFTDAKGEFTTEKEYLIVSIIARLDNSFSSYWLWEYIESNIKKLINILKKGD